MYRFITIVLTSLFLYGCDPVDYCVNDSIVEQCKKAYESGERGFKLEHKYGYMLLSSNKEEAYTHGISILKNAMKYPEAKTKVYKIQKDILNRYINVSDNAGFKETILEFYRDRNLMNHRIVYDLGIYIMEGKGFERNRAQGFSLIEKAAEMGNSEAADYLDKAYTDKSSGFWNVEYVKEKEEKAKQERLAKLAMERELLLKKIESGIAKVKKMGIICDRSFRVPTAQAIVDNAHPDYFSIAESQLYKIDCLAIPNYVKNTITLQGAKVLNGDIISFRGSKGNVLYTNVRSVEQ